MKKLTLVTTALYLTLASSAFADSNSLIITQASVGAGAPSLNFNQSGSGAAASIIQNGNDALTGVQVGTGGTKLNVDQENPTGGAVNTINYTGSSNSDVTIDQRATNGIFTASGSAGNTANVNMTGNAVVGGTTNKLFLDQVGYNNSANITSLFTGYAFIPSLAENFNIVQYSDNANSGNQFTASAVGASAAGTFNVLQQGGNKATVIVNCCAGQTANLAQINTADNIASANVANLTFGGADFSFGQVGTNNTLNANLGGNTANYGLTGTQTGNGNLATVVQVNAYLDTDPNSLTQTGNNNIATATQTNTHDSSFLIQQNGIGNTANLTQNGNTSTVAINQAGTSETVNWQQGPNNGNGVVSSGDTDTITQGNSATYGAGSGNTVDGTSLTWFGQHGVNSTFNAAQTGGGNTIHTSNVATSSTQNITQDGIGNTSWSQIVGTGMNTSTTQKGYGNWSENIVGSGSGLNGSSNSVYTISQTNTNASGAGNTAFIVADPVTNGNLAISQVGTGNYATIGTYGAGGPYLNGASGNNIHVSINQGDATHTVSGDKATATSYGASNTATISQYLDTNDTANISQNGTSLIASILQSGGTNNNASIVQTGNLNVASLTQSGSGATAIIAQH